MSKEEIKQELEKHGLDVFHFLDLRDAWGRLSGEEKLELLKEAENDSIKNKM